MKTTININGQDVEITLTEEQVDKITKDSKHKLFEYDVGTTCFIGTEAIRSGFVGSNTSILKYGRYRRTKEQAEIDFRRQTRMMRLSALAWEVGECKEFVYGEENWYINFCKNDSNVLREFDRNIKVDEKVYMTKETAIKVCDMLNSGEYSLDVE